MTTSLVSLLPSIPVKAGQTLPNLTIRLAIFSAVKKNAALFYYIQVQDGQTPEDIAYKYYGSEELYWIVLLMNDMVDPFYDWVLSDSELIQYVYNKYGEDKLYAVHHHEATASSDLDKGTWVNQGTVFSAPVTNLEYESELNERKRKIKLLNPAYVQQILAEVQSQLDKI